MAISLLSHLLSFDISWTSTSKEVTKSNFFLQVPKIWAAFKIQLILSFLILVSGRVVRFAQGAILTLVDRYDHLHHGFDPHRLSGQLAPGLDSFDHHLRFASHLAVRLGPVFHNVSS